ncbi:hypothetical protein [Streptomyces qinglanensis]|uniref:hypothetical protein n=1 Tax=Streptomyces qinglanensis TaxID=943816 RepID=UPI001112D938|nr:hypothetical protein [Streptomyces qinglanensis]
MRRKSLMVVSCIVFFCLLVGAFLVIQQKRKERFEGICNGVVQRDAVQVAAGGREVEAVDSGARESSESDGLPVKCEADTKDRSRHIEFSVGSSAYAIQILGQTLQENLFIADVSSPMGGGWTGTLTVQDPITAHATVVLKCSSGRQEYLLVSVKSLLVDTDTHFSENKSERLGLAQAVASVSKEANKRWKCGAQLGKKIRRAPADAIRSRAKPLAEATGTCRSMRKLTPVAKTWGITKTISTESTGEAPAQDCLLVDTKGQQVYRLSALTGPLAEGYRESGSTLAKVPGKAGREKRGGWAWASAKCPDGQSPALFTAASTGLGEDDRLEVSADFERELLKAFGSDMAALHGCEKPTLP